MCVCVCLFVCLEGELSLTFTLDEAPLSRRGVPHYWSPSWADLSERMAFKLPQVSRLEVRP